MKFRPCLSHGFALDVDGIGDRIISVHHRDEGGQDDVLVVGRFALPGQGLENFLEPLELRLEDDEVLEGCRPLDVLEVRRHDLEDEGIIFQQSCDRVDNLVLFHVLGGQFFQSVIQFHKMVVQGVQENLLLALVIKIDGRPRDVRPFGDVLEKDRAEFLLQVQGIHRIQNFLLPFVELFFCPGSQIHMRPLFDFFAEKIIKDC